MFKPPPAGDSGGLFDDTDDDLFGAGAAAAPGGLLGQSVDDSDMALMQAAGAQGGHARHSVSETGGRAAEAREIDLSDTTADDHQGDMDNFFDSNPTSPEGKDAGAALPPLPTTPAARAGEPDVAVPAASIRQRFRPTAEWDAIDNVRRGLLRLHAGSSLCGRRLLPWRVCACRPLLVCLFRPAHPCHSHPRWARSGSCCTTWQTSSRL